MIIEGQLKIYIIVLNLTNRNVLNGSGRREPLAPLGRAAPRPYEGVRAVRRVGQLIFAACPARKPLDLRAALRASISMFTPGRAPVNI